jgi:hypothetical protein
MLVPSAHGKKLARDEGFGTGRICISSHRRQQRQSPYSLGLTAAKFRMQADAGVLDALLAPD